MPLTESLHRIAPHAVLNGKVDITFGHAAFAHNSSFEPIAVLDGNEGIITSDVTCCSVVRSGNQPWFIFFSAILTNWLTLRDNITDINVLCFPWQLSVPAALLDQEALHASETKL